MSPEGWRTVRTLVPWIIVSGFIIWATHDYTNKAGVIHSLVTEGIRLFQGMKR
jgi:hypothetical protein